MNLTIVLLIDLSKEKIDRRTSSMRVACTQITKVKHNGMLNIMINYVESYQLMTKYEEWIKENACIQ